MQKEKNTNISHSRRKKFISFLQAKVKFCVTQHIDILYDPTSLLFPDLLVSTCFISTPKLFH